MKTTRELQAIQITVSLAELHVLVSALIGADLEHFVGLSALPELLGAKQTLYAFMHELGSAGANDLLQRLIKLHNATCDGHPLIYERTIK